MALSKDQKKAVVAKISGLLGESKMTVMARYSGTSVKAMQELRSKASGSGTQLHVVKNRLFKIALSSNDTLKQIDTSGLRGQLLYAFNSTDEVAPARAIAEFRLANPQIELVGAITADGQLLSNEDVISMALLPSKDALRAQLAGTVASPLSGLVNVLSGDIRGVLNVLTRHAETLTAQAGS